MAYRLAIFDFDGTLADSFTFFVSVFNQLADQHHFKKIDQEKALFSRGYHPRKMMSKVGLPIWKLPFVTKDFIALMQDNIDAIKPFDGVHALLSEMVKDGITIAIVSSNSYANISTVLGSDSVKLINHFECGMSIFGKSSRIKKVLNKYGIQNQDTIFIGDQISDIEASKKAKVAFGAVAWGYGTMDSLRSRSPTEEFNCMQDILKVSRPLLHHI
jgi:phosphoglycolate phosphatase